MSRPISLSRTERTNPRPHHVVTGCLGRRVWAGRAVRRQFVESIRAAQFEIAVDLVGGDVVKPPPVLAHRFQHGEGAYDIGVDEDSRFGQRVVVVRLGGEMYDHVVRCHEVVNQRGVRDIADNQLMPPPGRPDSDSRCPA